MSQKGRKGRDSPFFPPPTYLHTQEVTGLSPVISTKSLETKCFQGFFYFPGDARPAASCTEFEESQRCNMEKIGIKGPAEAGVNVFFQYGSSIFQASKMSGASWMLRSLHNSSSAFWADGHVGTVSCSAPESGPAAPFGPSPGECRHSRRPRPGGADAPGRR